MRYPKKLVFGMSQLLMCDTNNPDTRLALMLKIEPRPICPITIELYGRTYYFASRQIGTQSGPDRPAPPGLRPPFFHYFLLYLASLSCAPLAAQVLLGLSSGPPTLRGCSLQCSQLHSPHLLARVTGAIPCNMARA